MPIDYEKLVVLEVCRKVKKEHYFYEDLLQEARIALYSALQKIDETKTEHQKVFFLRRAVRWRISKAWRYWLKDVLLVSERSLQQRKADLNKREILEDFTLIKISDQSSVSDIVIKQKQIERLRKVLEDLVLTEEELVALQAFFDETDCRTLGKMLGKSHQGAINVQKRVLEKIKGRIL